MLYYGDSSNLGVISSDTLIFNITSMCEGLPRLQLVPPNTLGHLVDRDFDMTYANFIMSNDFAFTEFFTIIYNLYLGKDVYLVYAKDDWSENMAESLNKLIQQRYGYNAIKISGLDDYIYANNNITCTFNPDYGLANLDIDKDRYSYISESCRLNNGGVIYSED